MNLPLSKNGLNDAWIGFDEAKTVFNDPRSLTIHDAEHSDEEDRFIDVGISARDRVLVVSYMDRRMKASSGEASFEAAFMEALRAFEGSTAIAALGSDAPGSYALALRGSGQALYIGVFRGGYIFSSELYGVVEVASQYYKLNGEAEHVAGDPRTRGEVALLREGQPGSTGLRLFHYDGAKLAFTDGAIREVAKRAKARGTGARALRSVMEGVMLDLMFDLPERQAGQTYTIDEAVVKGEASPFQ